ncbi:MAG: hypothetical protein PSX79_13635 [bacterium]|nr:hypothetical protein [Alphaproteobacteria bacterium]MDI1365880.1 hypothetical protein [bacterium]
MENIDTVIALIAATGGLGLAAMSLVDAFKAVPGGGVSRIGFNHIRKVLRLFDDVLARAAGPEWETVVLSHWINGRARGEQIGVIRSLVRLGLNPDTAGQLASIGNVAAPALSAAAEKLVKGDALGEAEINLIGRVEAAVEARLDAAFDLADQSYRNASRVLAGLIAVALAVFAWAMMKSSMAPNGLLPADCVGSALNCAQAARPFPEIGIAVLIGLLAVPIAPIAKDLVSALTAASKAVQIARRP